jgi:uncharacterized protein (DUF952 family)
VAIFHLVACEQWARAEAAGSYAPVSLDNEGFIHFCTDRQLLRTADRFFADREDMLVISVREDRLHAPLRYEWVDGQEFPHLYGALNLDAVVDVVELPRGADGSFELPVAYRPWAAYFGWQSAPPKNGR